MKIETLTFITAIYTILIGALSISLALTYLNKDKLGKFASIWAGIIMLICGMLILINLINKPLI